MKMDFSIFVVVVLLLFALTLSVTTGVIYLAAFLIGFPLTFFQSLGIALMLSVIIGVLHRP